MLQVLQDLQVALDKGNKIIKEYEQKLLDLNNRTIDFKKTQDVHVQKASELSLREANVSHVESADDLMKSAQALMEDAKAKMDDVLSKEKDFNQKKDIANQELDSKRIQVRKEADSIEVGRKGIESEVKRRVDDIVAKLKKV